jgi:hypothetical protein
MAPYYLASHVQACFSANAAVLLDLRENRYLGLDAVQSNALRELINAPDKSDSQHGSAKNEVEKFANYLVDRKLLTRDCASGRIHKSISLQKPELPLVDRYDRESPTISVCDVLTFIHSVSLCGALQLTKRMEYAVNRLKLRKQGASELADYSVDALRIQVNIFSRIRTFFYASRERCLMDSIVLSEFLARRNLYPDFVIGVKAMPFLAHCWLQSGPFVLNGPAAYAQMFVPIVVV